MFGGTGEGLAHSLVAIDLNDFEPARYFAEEVCREVATEHTKASGVVANRPAFGNSDWVVVLSTFNQADIALAKHILKRENSWEWG